MSSGIYWQSSGREKCKIERHRIHSNGLRNIGIYPYSCFRPNHQERYGRFMIAFSLPSVQRYKRLFYSVADERRKRKLLSWVKSILPWIGEEVFDFTGCWQDGIVLCALMESVCPGVCPRFSLLKPHHRVNNCRLGIQLAMRYLGVSEVGCRFLASVAEWLSSS